MKKFFHIHTISLLISVVIVIPIAFVYGFKPILLFNISINTVNEANVFKGIMGLYLAFASFWILGISKPTYWKAATLSNIFFMLGLAFGRIVSMLFDGLPSTILTLGIIGELVLGFYSWYVLHTKKQLTNQI